MHIIFVRLSFSSQPLLLQIKSMNFPSLLSHALMGKKKQEINYHCGVTLPFGNNSSFIAH